MLQKKDGVLLFFPLFGCPAGDFQAVAEAETTTLHALFVQAVVHFLPFTPVDYNSRLAQQRQMPADCRLGQPDRTDYLVDCQLFSRQQGQNPQPGGITEGLKILAVCFFVYPADRCPLVMGICLPQYLYMAIC